MFTSLGKVLLGLVYSHTRRYLEDKRKSLHKLYHTVYCSSDELINALKYIDNTSSVYIDQSQLYHLLRSFLLATKFSILFIYHYFRGKMQILQTGFDLCNMTSIMIDNLCSVILYRECHWDLSNLQTSFTVATPVGR